MKRLMQRPIVTVLASALMTMSLTGCLAPSAPSNSADSDTDAIANSLGESRTPTGNPDNVAWKTLGDALAAAEVNPQYGYSEDYYTGIIRTDGRDIYVVAKLTPQMYAAYDKDGEDALSSAELVINEDVTYRVAPQEVLDSFEGRTGQDLIDAGFSFRNYRSYGGDETIATFDNGFYGYIVTFAASISEQEIDEDGSALRTAIIAAVEASGEPSAIATDPVRFTQLAEVSAAGIVASPSTDTSHEK